MWCVQVEKSRTFRREGPDIHSDVVISLSQAILGGTVRVPGITDHVLLNVSVTSINTCSQSATDNSFLPFSLHLQLIVKIYTFITHSCTHKTAKQHFIVFNCGIVIEFFE